MLTNQPKSQDSSEQDQLEKSVPSFTTIESRVFTKIGKDIYIGTESIQPVVKSLLRDEAKAIKATRLWEILNASIINEAYNLALLQSKNFDEVTSAKMLKHWSFFMMNVLHILEKNE